MQEHITYNAHELQYLVIPCRCGAEVSFDLRETYKAVKMTCPVCDGELVGVQRQEGGFDFNLITLYQTFFKAKGANDAKFRVSKPTT